MLKRAIQHHERVKDLAYLHSILRGVLRIWMIHELRPNQITTLRDHLKEGDILVWDDALLSQYFVIKSFSEYTNILAVSSAIATRASHLQEQDSYNPVAYIASAEAHDQYHKHNDASAFMGWDHIQDLEKRFKVLVACHGHHHTSMRILYSRGYDTFADEVVSAQKEFQNHIGYTPEVFVYPYNDTFPASDALLMYFGYTLLLGPARIDANTILNTGG